MAMSPVDREGDEKKMEKMKMENVFNQPFRNLVFSTTIASFTRTITTIAR
jgi:hypothetical protein